MESENPKWKYVHLTHSCGEDIFLPGVAFSADAQVIFFGECDECGEQYEYIFTLPDIMSAILAQNDPDQISLSIN